MRAVAPRSEERQDAGDHRDQRVCRRQVRSGVSEIGGDLDALLLSVAPGRSVADIRAHSNRRAVPGDQANRDTETLAAGIDYVSDSAVPQPIGVGPERTLSWLENYVPDEGLTMTYRVMPREIGERAISQGASAWLVGNNNARFQVVAPTPPPVLVLQPFPAAPTRAPRP